MKDPQNLLIRAWTADARDYVFEQSINIEFAPGDWLCRDGERLTHFIFPHSGILVASAANQSLEMKSTGKEGFVGIPLLLAGGDSAGDVKGLVAGTATLVPCARLHQANTQFPSVAQSLALYCRFAIHTLMQTVACVRSQNAENVIALWLLTAAAKLPGREIPITHEVLANLLGVRRATVTTTLSKFSKESLIETGRGRVRITDVPGLERYGGQYFSKWKEALAGLMAPLEI